MGDRNFTVKEVCRCGNEARMTTIQGARLCGVCAADNQVVCISDDRIPELLGVLKNALGGGSITLEWLREQLIPIIGRVAPR